MTSCDTYTKPAWIQFYCCTVCWHMSIVLWSKNDLNYQETWIIEVHNRWGLNLLTLSLWIKPGQIRPVTMAQMPLNFVGYFSTIKKPYQVRVSNNGPILVTVELQGYATHFLSSGVSWGQVLPSPLARSHAWEGAKGKTHNATVSY